MPDIEDLLHDAAGSSGAPLRLDVIEARARTLRAQRTLGRFAVAATALAACIAVLAGVAGRVTAIEVQDPMAPPTSAAPDVSVSPAPASPAPVGGGPTQAPTTSEPAGPSASSRGPSDQPSTAPSPTPSATVTAEPTAMPTPTASPTPTPTPTPTMSESTGPDECVVELYGRCSYVARSPGGYDQVGTDANLMFWTITIRRGDRTIELTNTTSPPCGATGVIRPGDQVEVSVNGGGGTAYYELRVGAPYHC